MKKVQEDTESDNEFLEDAMCEVNWFFCFEILNVRSISWRGTVDKPTSTRQVVNWLLAFQTRDDASMNAAQPPQCRIRLMQMRIDMLINYERTNEDGCWMPLHGGRFWSWLEVHLETESCETCIASTVCIVEENKNRNSPSTTETDI